MLGKYAARVAALPPAARAALAEELELEVSRRVTLVQALEGARLCSADVVLVLLRRGMAAEASRVAGVPVRRYISGVPPEPRPAAIPARQGDDRRLVAVVRPYPGRVGTDAAARYGLLRVGMTLAGALRRGVRRRDLLVWLRQGWAVVEGDDG